ncbi:hypothetical protein ACHAW5_006794, partial [Stephanodiscus triporus]
SSSSSSCLLERRPCPGGIDRGGGVGPPPPRLTPLAMASYNPDVSPIFVRLLVDLEPRATDVECDFPPRGGGGGGALAVPPLLLAASSPLPNECLFERGRRLPPLLLAASSLFERGRRLRERRWEKVAILTVSNERRVVGREGILASLTGDNYYDHDDVVLPALPPTPAPTSAEVRVACAEAVRRDEWELAREYARRYPRFFEADDDDDDCNDDIANNIRRALARHDDDEGGGGRGDDGKKREGRRRGAAARGMEWLRKYMGPVAYEVDVAMDLVRAVIPARKRERNDDRDGGIGRRGIVMPMS